MLASQVANLAGLGREGVAGGLGATLVGVEVSERAGAVAVGGDGGVVDVVAVGSGLASAGSDLQLDGELNTLAGGGGTADDGTLDGVSKEAGKVAGEEG